jgi:hypothetical protein
LSSTGRTAASQIRLAFIIAGAAVLATACSTSPKTATPPKVTHAQVTVPAAATSSAAAPATSTSAPAAAAGLSGKWSGQYSGAYSGTFSLNWTQAGSSLSGHIALSYPAGDVLSLHGSVNGSTITFGTVGSTAITYSGTVSGNSMSGNYQVQGSGGGPWSATKSS